jgi:1-acyl-sn-glycerol-3-phosphate acyltransferase
MAAPGTRLLARVRSARFPLAAPSWPASVDRPDPERSVGMDYDHEWSRRYPVRLARAMVLDNVARPAARLFAPATVRGLEHLQHVEGPVIFAANHASHVDTPLLLTTLPVEFRHRTVVAAASDYFFDRTWKAVLWTFALAAIPIERSKVNRKSADTAAQVIEDGWNLVIFPEGGRSPDGWTQPFRGGAAYLARRTGRPVVPVYLHGTRRVLPKSVASEEGGRGPGGSGSEARRGGRLRRAPIAVLFGAPMSPDEGESAHRFSERVEAAVATLAREVYSDWWRARRDVSAVAPLAGAETAHRGPEAAAWRRAWALDAAAGRAQRVARLRSRGAGAVGPESLHASRHRPPLRLGGGRHGLSPPRRRGPSEDRAG